MVTNQQFHNKVHTFVTNLAKIQSGYYYISLLLLETIVPGALNIKNSHYEKIMATIIRYVLIISNFI